jgi:hypothetical protein
MKRNSIIIVCLAIFALGSAFTSKLQKPLNASGYFINPVTHECVAGVTDQADCSGTKTLCTINNVSPAYKTLPDCSAKTSNVWKQPQ